MAVISLDERRSRRVADAPARCACGSEWFTLDGRSAAPDVAPHGAITLNQDGAVTGRVGQVVCLECGEELALG